MRYVPARGQIQGGGKRKRRYARDKTERREKETQDFKIKITQIVRTLFLGP